MEKCLRFIIAFFVLLPTSCFADTVEENPFDHLQNLLEIDPFSLNKPDRANLWNHMGQLYLATGANTHAIASFLRARKITGPNPFIDRGIAMAYRNLGVPPPLLPKTHASLEKKIFLPFFFATFLLLSLFIWTKVKFWIQAAIWVGAGTLGIFLLVLYNALLTPISGVVVHTTPLYSQNETDHDVNATPPLLPGQLVKVMLFSLNNEQALIRDQNGRKGFVSVKAIALI